MLGTNDHDEFITRSIIAIATTLRADGSPASSMISFVRLDDRLYFTTTMDRLKGRSLARDPRVTLTVLNPHEPWSFVSVEGLVRIHRDNPPELRSLVVALADHPDYPWSRSEVDAMVTAPGRAIFELNADRVSGVVFPVLDERRPEEIIGYDEHGLPS
jgi:PPOX class probable F420-dependent enzyme